MPILIVVSNPKDWKLNIPGVEVVSNKSYLTDPHYLNLKNARVFNLSRSYRYQSNGYYVSLLAVARGHKPLPSVSAIQDMKSPAVIKIISEELEDVIQKSLSDLKSRNFTLSIYFGRNTSKKYNKLSLMLFNLFQVPLLRAYFEQDEDGWKLDNIGPIASADIPDDHKPFVETFAGEYFKRRRFAVPERDVSGYDLAILVNPNEKAAPSDTKTIDKFIKAAEKTGISAETISRDDYARLAEYDALFIRETTAVNHHTFRFAQRAKAEGLVVIDDPDSIIRCTNKVYLAELLAKHEIPSPKTIIIHKDNVHMAAEVLGFPLVLKQPDSSFSQGVVKVKDQAEYQDKLDDLFGKSDLLIGQEFLPTDYDWRVGILNRKPLYACKYYMAKKHWQIMNWETAGARRFGKAETFPVETTPRGVIKTALKAANLIGDGLYGVDLKEIDGKIYVIEVNDNPSIDTGVEDDVVKEKLYLEIMQTFLEKIKAAKQMKKGDR